jgi:prepilin-type N-terminal cleavage/methylation domain-containing protein
MNIRRKDKGFTIIEVVLVLAIAGLIFLMVFIALPALQRAQRDSQRKSDLARLETAVTSYTSNNRGSLPSNWSSFVSQYLTPTASDTFIDPSGAPSGHNDTTYVMTPSSGTESPASGDSNNFNDSTQNVIYYSVGYICGSTGGSITAGGNRKVALRMYLEGGGITCQNN